MKLWGGRFQKETSQMMDDFHSSISFDQRLFAQDIRGSMAHARMLCRQGILSAADEQASQAGLQGILQDMQDGKIDFPPESEDIHMLVESILTERIGDAGKRLHTGRSRNDQVALDMHLYAKETCGETIGALRALEETLLTLAQKHAGDVMPGFFRNRIKRRRNTAWQRTNCIKSRRHWMISFSNSGKAGLYTIPWIRKCFPSS